MASPDAAPTEPVITDPFTAIQAEISELEPFLREVPLDILEAETPYPVSSDFARHMGAKGVAAFNASYVELSQELSRPDLIEAAKQAVADSKRDDVDELPEAAQRRVIFARGFTLSLLDMHERHEALGSTS